jgi:hypothetical protein
MRRSWGCSLARCARRWIVQRSAASFARNLESYLNGEALLNRVLR